MLTRHLSHSRIQTHIYGEAAMGALGVLSTGPDLRYCTEWRRWLWTQPVRWVLGDVGRFHNKRVLEIGCRFGKMSCYFARLGAFVDGVDIYDSHIKLARMEAEK